MIASLLLAALTATPAPAPSPPLKTIVTVKVSPFCNAVRNLAVPVGYVNAVNDQAFDAINRSMLQFLLDNRGLSAVSKADVDSLDNGYDDSATYNAHNTLSMNKLSKIVWQINQNLSLEDDVMQKSWKSSPQGQDPQIDAMRQRLQNLIDLQRALSSRYTQLAELYFDNEGNSQFSIDQQTGDTNDVVAYKSMLRSLIFGQASALALARQANYDPTKVAEADASDTAHTGNLNAVVKQLVLQEQAFKPEILKAGDACGV